MNNYVLEREKRMNYALSRKVFSTSGPIIINSISNLLKKKVKEFIFGLPRFILLAVINYREYIEIFSIKGVEKGRKALVIGHGPSLGLIDGFVKDEDLNEFDIITINYWQDVDFFNNRKPNILVLSDPLIIEDLIDFDYRNLNNLLIEKNRKLIESLVVNKNIKIYCPIQFVSKISSFLKNSSVYGFVDLEMSHITNNTDIRLPRGYCSVTVYKAIAIAEYLEYEKIFILGIDNTYPHDLLCNERNEILRIDTRIGADPKLIDFSSHYSHMGAWAQDIFYLFNDLNRCFGQFKNIINLDPYSLVDTFSKAPVKKKINT